jgi:hypothetical protein
MVDPKSGFSVRRQTRANRKQTGRGVDAQLLNLLIVCSCYSYKRQSKHEEDYGRTEFHGPSPVHTSTPTGQIETPIKVAKVILLRWYCGRSLFRWQVYYLLLVSKEN